MTISVLKPIAEDSKPQTGLSDEARRLISERLHRSLEDTLSLLVDTQLCHWNVVGPLFKPIHDLTEEHYNDLFAAADDIAERIRALGHPVSIARPTVDASSERARAPARSAVAMIRDLSRAHEDIVRDFRKTATLAEEHCDLVTHDLLVQRMTFHEKAVWMLKSMIAE